MKIVFLGATKYSEEMLLHLINNNFDVNAVFMIPQTFDLKKNGQELSQSYQNSNYSNLSKITNDYSIPCYVVDSKDGRKLTAYSDVLKQIKPDIILVLGWYYMVPKTIRNIAKLGAFGIHASLLPDYAGGSPLVWAIINGEKSTGITLFRFEDGVDDGDILAQKEIQIGVDDTIATLYGKVTEASKAMLIEELDKLKHNKHVFIKQNKAKIRPFPIRTPDDGKIDWSLTDLKLYDFIRAQTKPYPCAFSFLRGKKIKFLSMLYPDRIYDSYSQCVNGEIVLNNSKCFVKVSNNIVEINTINVDGIEQKFNGYCLANNLVGDFFD